MERNPRLAAARRVDFEQELRARTWSPTGSGVSTGPDFKIRFRGINDGCDSGTFIDPPYPEHLKRLLLVIRVMI